MGRPPLQRMSLVPTRLAPGTPGVHRHAFPWLAYVSLAPQTRFWEEGPWLVLLILAPLVLCTLWALKRCTECIIQVTPTSPHDKHLDLNPPLANLLLSPWKARRLNQPIFREINLEYSLEGLMLKLKLQYFSHLM